MTKEMSDSDETSSLAVLARSSISSFTNESKAQSLERQKQSLDEEYRNRPLRISSQELEWIHLLRARPESNDLPEFRSWIDQVVKATDKIGGEASASTELSTSESPSNTGNSSSEDGSSDAKEGTSESSAEESAIDKHKRTHENDGFSGSASSSYGASTSNTSSLSSEEGSASSDDPTSSSSVLEVNRITDDSADSGKQ